MGDPASRRYPYRAVGEVEDIIAHQLAVVMELEVMRRAATDLRAKTYLRDQEVHARVVLDWLRDLRGEMRER